MDSVPERPPLSADHDDDLVYRHIPALGVPPAMLPSVRRASVVGRTPSGKPDDALKDVPLERKKDVTSQFVAARRFVEPDCARARTSAHPGPASEPAVVEISARPAPRPDAKTPEVPPAAE